MVCMDTNKMANAVAIIDDEELIRESLRGLMKGAGFRALL